MPDRIADLPLRRPVVVGVDGSRNNQAAVRYAVEEAAGTRRPLLLVAVLDDTGDPSVPQQSPPDWTLLNAIGRRATRQHPDLRVRSTLEFGDVPARLLDRARRADRLVIGQRGLGTFGQPILGSTSTAVAARSDRPVLIVPAGWRHEDRRRHPVVVGIDPTDPDDSAVCFAFEEAARRESALVAVHAFDTEPRLLWDPVLAGPAHRTTQTLGARHLEDVVATFSSVFPSVPVTLCDERSDPATMLLRRSRAAQLLVLGRGQRRTFGPGLGSTSRAVLHYVEIPVAVIPG
ncbi:universal stress protein [Nocardioides jensenii]|uniref:universal stress protein n=1 Tax=Nocardioides jensenii TaxID=1843 RepID=UPI00082ED8B1|nr:universal stress protein [Nocardioides jensenii]